MTSSPWLETSDGLKKTFAWKTFGEALGFVLEVGALAEKVNHHPDIDIRWNKVHLTLITHDAGNQVTAKDRTLAEAIDAIPASVVKARAEALNAK